MAALQLGRLRHVAAENHRTAAETGAVSVSPADLGGPFACVFDVGAFQGDFARACLAEWPECRVESFEPLLDTPFDLEHKNGVPCKWCGRWRWHHIAVGVDRGSVQMYQCQFLPSSSMLKMTDLHKEAFPYTRENKPVMVDMHPLRMYAPFVEKPALLKIDVQGLELEVLKGAPLGKFQAVVLEVSHETLYEGAPTPPEIAAFLTASGMKHVRRVDEMLDPRDGRLLQSDELYAR